MDRFRWREADAGHLARGFGRQASAPDVVEDAGELLARYPPGEPVTVPLPWRPTPRHPAVAQLTDCGLIPALSD